MRLSKFRPFLLAASAVSVVAVCNPALAQDAQAPGSGPAAGSSEIVVTGFKQSLEDALNMKRSNSGVSDSISSEDIGKSTDQNIAEALQRVTGVAIDRTDGEGSTVSVRGAGPDLNNVTLNGVPLSANGENQSVDFSQFSSDILQSITVNKTSSADQNEGSLGGTIVLKTFRPLSIKKDRLILEVQGRYNEFLNTKGRFGGLDDVQDYRLNASLVKHFLDNTLGVSVVATRETSSLRKDEYDNTWFLTGNYNYATNVETGERIQNYDSNGDGINDTIVGRENRQLNYNHYVNQRDRDSLTGTVQWKPDNQTEVVLNATYSKQRVEIERHQFATTSAVYNDNGPGSSVIYDPSTGTFVENIFQQRYSATALSPNNLRQPGVIRIFQQEQAYNVNNLILSGELNRRFGRLKASLKGGRSITKQEDEYFLQGRASVTGPSLNNLSLDLDPVTGLTTTGNANSRYFYNGYSCIPDPTICQLIVNPEVPDNPAYFRPNNISQRDLSFRDEIYSGYLDFDWDVQFGPITAIKFGGKYEDRKKNTASTTAELNNAQLGGQYNTVSLAGYSNGSTPSDFGQNLGLGRDALTDGWFIWDVRRSLADALEKAGGAEQPPIEPDLKNIRAIQQQVQGAYVMAEYELFDKSVWGNIGMRYAKTDVSAQGYAGLQFSGVNFFSDDNKAFFGIDPADPNSNAQLAALIGQNTYNRDAAGNPITGGNVTPPPTYLSDNFTYENWLPSFNVNWAVTRKLLVRFGASETIARPPIDNLKPGFVINEAYTNPESIGTFGNTQLRPFKARNLDLSIEWYFRPDSLFSVAFFDKQLTDFVENSNTLYYWRDVRDQIFDQNTGAILPEDQISFVLTNPDQILLPASAGDQQPGCMANREMPLGGRQVTPQGVVACDQLNVSRPRNGAGGYVRGVEMTLQHNLTWLPGFFGGFGFSTNYTYADSKTDEEIEYDPNTGDILNFFPAFPLIGTSKHTVNGTVFWEKKGKLVRVAYNWRSDYLVDRNVRDGGAHWIEGYATLDVSASWKVTNNFTVNFQGQNLLDTVTRTYSTTVLDGILGGEGSAFDGATKLRTSSLSNTGRIYRVGLRFQF